MRVTRHLPDNQIQFEYSLHQQKLEQVHSAEYLEITITDNLDGGQHVSKISCKAIKTMGYHRRDLELTPRHSKEVAFKYWFFFLHLASLSRNSDCTDGEGAGQLPGYLQAMEKYK